MEISKKTIEVLKDAGWYEGRKIDIAENVKFLEERGFEVLESAKKFMEEFGELKIKVEDIGEDGKKYFSEHTTCIKEVVGIENSANFDLKKYEDQENEKVMLIGALYDCDRFLYISESGRIFDSVEWAGYDALEAWDNIISEKGIIIDMLPKIDPPRDSVKYMDVYIEAEKLDKEKHKELKKLLKSIADKKEEQDTMYFVNNFLKVTDSFMILRYYYSGAYEILNVNKVKKYSIRDFDEKYIDYKRKTHFYHEKGEEAYLVSVYEKGYRNKEWVIEEILSRYKSKGYYRVKMGNKSGSILGLFRSLMGN